MSNNDPIPFPKNTNINPQKVKPLYNNEDPYIYTCNTIPELKPGEIKPEDLQIYDEAVGGPIYIVKMLKSDPDLLYNKLHNMKVKILSKVFSPEKKINDKHVNCPSYYLKLKIIDNKLKHHYVKQSKQQIKGQLKEQLKEELEMELKEKVSQELEHILKQEMQERLGLKSRPELKEKLKQQLKHKFGAKLEQRFRRQLESEFRHKYEQKLRDELEQNVERKLIQAIGAVTAYKDINEKVFEFYLAEDSPELSPSSSADSSLGFSSDSSTGSAERASIKAHTKTARKVGGRRKSTRHRKQGRKQVTRRIKRNRTLRGRRRH